MMAPYYLPLEILSNASRHLSQDGLTPQDRKFLSIVKGKWSEMMNRVRLNVFLLTYTLDDESVTCVGLE